MILQASLRLGVERVTGQITEFIFTNRTCYAQAVRDAWQVVLLVVALPESTPDHGHLFPRQAKPETTADVLLIKPC
jgi:hypothetical protein